LGELQRRRGAEIVERFDRDQRDPGLIQKCGKSGGDIRFGRAIEGVEEICCGGILPGVV
jgi:hypothetical protein